MRRISHFWIENFARSLRQAVRCHVRFGSLADIEALSLDVRFTPKSGHWNSIMFVPKADIQ